MKTFKDLHQTIQPWINKGIKYEQECKSYDSLPNDDIGTPVITCAYSYHKGYAHAVKEFLVCFALFLYVTVAELELSKQQEEMNK